MNFYQNIKHIILSIYSSIHVYPYYKILYNISFLPVFKFSQKVLFVPKMIFVVWFLVFFFVCFTCSENYYETPLTGIEPLQLVKDWPLTEPTIHTCELLGEPGTSTPASNNVQPGMALSLFPVSKMDIIIDFFFS